MTAERQPNTEAELEQYQYENPFADFPTYEEMQKLRKQDGQADQAPVKHIGYMPRHATKQETPVAEMFDNPFADDYKPRHAAAEAPAETPKDTESGERRIVNRHITAAGERSTLYKLEMSDGKEGTELESDYLEIASQFRKDHEDLKKDFSLDMAMIGFSTDIAIVDATHGDCFNDANDEQRAALLEDYGKLRSRLDNPNSAKEDKQIISEYLGKMQGHALDFIQTQYEQNKDKNQMSERLKAEIEELADQVKASRKQFEYDYQDYEKIARGVEDLLNQPRKDYEEIHYAINKLKHAIEDAMTSAKKYQSNNNDYGDILLRNRSQMDQETFMSGTSDYEDADKDVSEAIKTLSNADEYAYNLGRKIKNILNNF